MNNYAVFLDVDGVINSIQHLYSEGVIKFDYETKSHRLNGYNVWIPEYMPELIQAIYKSTDLYWLTTWRDNANEYVSPALGIPTDIPVIDDGTKQRSPGWKFNACYPLAKKLHEQGQTILWIEDFAGHVDNRLKQYLTYIDTDRNDEGVFLPQHLPESFLDFISVKGGYDGPTYVEAPHQYGTYKIGPRNIGTGSRA